MCTDTFSRCVKGWCLWGIWKTQSERQTCECNCQHWVSSSRLITPVFRASCFLLAGSETRWLYMFQWLPGILKQGFPALNSGSFLLDLWALIHLGSVNVSTWTLTWILEPRLKRNRELAPVQPMLALDIESPFSDAVVHHLTELICHLLLDPLCGILTQTIHCKVLGASVEMSLRESRHQHSWTAPTTCWYWCNWVGWPLETVVIKSCKEQGLLTKKHHLIPSECMGSTASFENQWWERVFDSNTTTVEKRRHRKGKPFGCPAHPQQSQVIISPVSWPLDSNTVHHKSC